MTNFINWALNLLLDSWHLKANTGNHRVCCAHLKSYLSGLNSPQPPLSCSSAQPHIPLYRPPSLSTTQPLSNDIISISPCSSFLFPILFTVWHNLGNSRSQQTRIYLPLLRSRASVWTVGRLRPMSPQSSCRPTSINSSYQPYPLQDRDERRRGVE